MRRRRRGFSLTELMVVIGIIVLLVGILLVALRAVQAKARESRTNSTMQQFRAACEAFQTEHGAYPGVVPDTILAADPKISPMENALLHLLGGYRVPTDADYGTFTGTVISFGPGPDFEFKVDPDLIGDGPVINGQPYAAYFTPTDNELVRVQGQVGEDPSLMLPDLVDAWGQPILYLRRVRKQGPLVGSDPATAQFLWGGVVPYINSASLGELSANQVYGAGTNEQGSILSTGSAAQRHNNLAQIIRHPAFGDWGNTPTDAVDTGEPRGAFVVISAGDDGIYFSATDGFGTDSSPQTDLTMQAPTVLEEYDDIRVFGGS